MSDCPYCNGTGGRPVKTVDGDDWSDCPACGGTGTYSISDRRIRAALLDNDNEGDPQ